jgi:hypothetical protein
MRRMQLPYCLRSDGIRQTRSVPVLEPPLKLGFDSCESRRDGLSPAPEWAQAGPGRPGGKQNACDREHFGGPPVSKTIERAGHLAVCHCSVSRALRGRLGFQRQFFRPLGGVAAIGTLVFGIGRFPRCGFAGCACDCGKVGGY